MSADVEQVRLIKSQALSLIQTLTVDPKPSYQLDGQSVSWADYLAQLRATVEWCERQLAAGEPFEFRSRGCT